MSEKRHTINKFVNYQNIMVRNSPAFDRHNFVPSQKPLIFGFWVMRFASCDNIVWISLKRMYGKDPKGLTDAFYGCEIVENTFGFLWFIHLLKTVHLQQLKGMQKSKLFMWKGYHLSVGGIRRYFSCRTTGLDSGAEPPPIKLCRVPTPDRNPLFH